jgi:hypothetical protein
LCVTIPFKDKALSLIFVEVLILYRSGIFRSNHLHALRRKTLKLFKLAIMYLQSGYTLDLVHCLQTPRVVGLQRLMLGFTLCPQESAEDENRHVGGQVHNVVRLRRMNIKLLLSVASGWWVEIDILYGI